MRLSAALFALLLSVSPAWAGDQSATPPSTIKIGDIASYTGWANYAEPYRKGWQLALKEVNQEGGVLGRPLEVVSRDDHGSPSDTSLLVQEMVGDQDVSVILGSMASNVTLALSQECLKNHIPCVAPYGAADRLLWADGHPYIFRLIPSSTALARIMFDQIKNSPKKRWAIVSAQYEFGQNMVRIIHEEIKRLRPDIEIVSEQWVPWKKIQAGAVINALNSAKPEGIFLCLVTPDLAPFVREGIKRKAFDNVQVVSYVLQRQDVGELYDIFPQGWVGFGYDSHHIEGPPQHKVFVDAYRREYGEYPDDASARGYTLIKLVATAIKKAGTPEREAVKDALTGLPFDTPFGTTSFRLMDNQAHMGVWSGEVAKDDHGKTYMKNTAYISGESFWPRPDDTMPTQLETR